VFRSTPPRRIQLLHTMNVASTASLEEIRPSQEECALFTRDTSCTRNYGPPTRAICLPQKNSAPTHKTWPAQRDLGPHPRNSTAARETRPSHKNLASTQRTRPSHKDSASQQKNSALTQELGLTQEKISPFPRETGLHLHSSHTMNSASTKAIRPPQRPQSAPIDEILNIECKWKSE
jgi:hypothetical protein